MYRQVRSNRLPAYRIAMLWALVAAAVLLGGCGQSGTARLVLRDEGEQLDQQRISAAAAPLLARDASVAVLIVERGDDSGADLERRLTAEGLLAGADIPPALLVVYVSYEPRYSELRAGSKWSDLLPAARLREIREELLNQALRADDPDDGVATTLTALEAELASGLRFQALLGWSVLALVLGAMFVLLLRRPVEQLWWRLSKAWPNSPPGRLWAATPPGRRQVRQRYGLELEAAGRALATRGERASERFARSAVADAALAARLAALEATRVDLAQRAALAKQPSDDPQLLKALRELPGAYEQLALDAEQLASRVGLIQLQLASAARRAAELGAQVTASFEPQPGQMAGTPEVYRKFARLRSRLEVLNQQRETLEQAPLTAELEAQLGALANEYPALEGDFLALWKASFPGAHGAYAKAQRRKAAKQRSRQSDSSSAATASSSYIASSSSSDYQSDYPSDSGSSSSSSDGGAW